MTGQALFLGMALTAFATFMVTLGAVSVWVRLGSNPPKA